MLYASDPPNMSKIDKQVCVVNTGVWYELKIKSMGQN